MISRALLAASGSSRTALVIPSRRSLTNGFNLKRLYAQNIFPGNKRFETFRPQQACISMLASLSIDEPTRSDGQDRASFLSCSLFQYQQVRWKRKGGASAFSKPRPISRKKLKTYNRRKKEQHYQKFGRHSKPGSKAKIRRQYSEERWDSLLNHNPKDTGFDDPKQLEYDLGDALLDDVIGNTAQLTSTPTPKPSYLGHLHKTFYNRIAEQMDEYQQHQQLLLEDKAESTDAALSTSVSLPLDRDISLVLRSYRDRHGTKSKPIGIVKALQHLLQDLKLPTCCFGELTFTTLLTCCRTPREARRIFKLQKESQHIISSYSWSILVDIHAKMGDFEGCTNVMEEMVSEGIQPTLAAYTSLLAACYKVCNAGGRVPTSIRSQAGKLAWNKWKEMRIIGLEPDVMAYGAMLRICAARGHPERALSILEEMQTNDVKPTTLCFTSALRAVAKSHQTAVRYERGFSKKNRRREHITAHHGKMARAVCILAESAAVDQDDGFVAALMLCAAAAGDSATAKAILLASQVRRMDHLRTIGSDTHLQQLRGEQQVMSQNDDGLSQLPSGDESTLSFPTLGDSSVAPQRRESGRRYPSFEDREYGGRDTRALSALLLACSQAAENRGLGDIWAGRENKGYLCDNSLRLITVRPTPKYDEERIPGVSHQEVAHSALVWDEEEPENMGKRLRRAKFRGVDIDPDAGFTLDELDDQLYDMFANNENEDTDGKNDETTTDAHEMVMGEDGKIGQDHIDMIEGGLSTAYFDAATGTMHTSDGQDENAFVVGQAKNSDESQQPSESEEEYYFDYDARKWKTRPKVRETSLDVGGDASSGTKENSIRSMPSAGEQTVDEDEFQVFFEGLKEEVMASGEDIEVEESDARAFFEEMQNEELPGDKDITTEEEQESTDDAEIDLDEFTMFYEGLKEQIKESGETMSVSEAEARDLFAMMKDEFEVDKDDTPPPENASPSENAGVEEAYSPTAEASSEPEFKLFYESLKDEAIEAGGGGDIDEADARKLFYMMKDEVGADEHGASSSPEAGALSPKSTTLFGDGSKDPQRFDDFLGDLKDEWRADGIDVDSFGEADESLGNPSSSSVNPTELATPKDLAHPSGTAPTSVVAFDDHLGTQSRVVEESLHETEYSAVGLLDGTKEDSLVGSQMEAASLSTSSTTVVPSDASETSAEVIHNTPEASEMSFSEMEKELEKVLPGMPHSRIKKIRNAFFKSLGDPSMLRLTPLLRENMPDFVTRGWLKRKNLQNAAFVMRKAKEDDLLDVHMLNGMLQVESSCGGLDRALAFHQEQFKRFNVKPTAYSDRMVLQMLVKNNRLPRALAFKQKVEEAGRTLDIQSYGSIMEHYGNKQQLGSALLVLKECIAVHGAPPGEKCLKKIRLLCRQHNVNDEQIGLTEMIGKDPVEWIRHGEHNLKREYSYRGRRNVLLPRNRMVQI